MPDSVIAAMEALADNEQEAAGITFTDFRGCLISEPNAAQELDSIAGVDGEKDPNQAPNDNTHRTMDEEADYDLLGPPTAPPTECETTGVPNQDNTPTDERSKGR